jgi:hypothetical protein
MFGLTRREQRWKAEQKAAETLIPLIAATVQAAAEIRVAEANTDAEELERLRNEVKRLQTIEAAARNLVKVKGRYHTEQAFKALAELLVNTDAQGR